MINEDLIVNDQTDSNDILDVAQDTANLFSDETFLEGVTTSSLMFGGAIVAFGIIGKIILYFKKGN